MKTIHFCKDLEAGADIEGPCGGIENYAGQLGSAGIYVNGELLGYITAGDSKRALQEKTMFSEKKGVLDNAGNLIGFMPSLVYPTTPKKIIGLDGESSGFGESFEGSFGYVHAKGYLYEPEKDYPMGQFSGNDRELLDMEGNTFASVEEEAGYLPLYSTPMCKDSNPEATQTVRYIRFSSDHEQMLFLEKIGKTIPWEKIEKN